MAHAVAGQAGVALPASLARSGEVGEHLSNTATAPRGGAMSALELMDLEDAEAAMAARRQA